MSRSLSSFDFLFSNWIVRSLLSSFSSFNILCHEGVSGSFEVFCFIFGFAPFDFANFSNHSLFFSGNNISGLQRIRAPFTPLYVLFAIDIWNIQQEVVLFDYSLLNFLLNRLLFNYFAYPLYFHCECLLYPGSFNILYYTHLTST